MLTIHRLAHYPQANALSNHCIVAWVTRPERPKGAKDEVKQARRAASSKTSRLLVYFFWYTISYANWCTFVWCKYWEVGKYLDPLLETISAVSKTLHPNLLFFSCKVFTAVTAIKHDGKKRLTILTHCVTLHALNLLTIFRWQFCCKNLSVASLLQTETPTEATVTNTSANYRAHNFGLMAKLSRKGKRRI